MMTFSNVRLILAREIRDQLRDRRTLFMIFVLPVVLYPLLGISMFQISQFMQEHPTRVMVAGVREFESEPALFEKGQFAQALFLDPSRARLLELHFANGVASDARAEASSAVQSGEYEAAVYFPPDFAERLAAFRAAIHERVKQRQSGQSDAAAEVRLEVPSPEIIYSTANDKSQIAFARVSEVLRRWTDQIGDDNLAAGGMSKGAIQPFLVESADVADRGHRGASAWSKILPVMMLLWVLTGAFYPAIDLCAGEKERGTLETLLCSPARRSEIVVGKLGAIMVFSMATAALNLLSIGATGWMVVTRLPDLALPSPTAIAALAVALVPMSALFGALCLALAAFARSTKEGQYYLMPMLFITMPLVVLPMSPGVELNLGTSLIPITGVVLLLRNVLEGSYWQAVQYSPTVVGVTLASCLLAIRWAIEQFNSEAVLFRESERLDLGRWLRSLFVNRQATPSAAAATCCGVLILGLNFFVSFSLAVPEGFGDFVRSVLTTQLLVIAVPAVLLTLLLSRSPRQTLLLKRPPWLAIPAAALLAVSLHPAVNVLQVVVRGLYPEAESVRPALEKMQAMFCGADFWSLILIIALAPAVCEELAFRGFILSGFRRTGRTWRAIVLSSLLFGMTHGILQQSLLASLLGVVLAVLAVSSGSILPGMVFHVVHNTLAVSNARVTPEMFPQWAWLRALVAPGEEGGCVFQWPLIVVGLLVGVLIVTWFSRLNSPKRPIGVSSEAAERDERNALPLVPAGSPLSLGEG